MTSLQHLSIEERDDTLILTVLDERLTNDTQVNEWKDQMIAEILNRSPTGAVIDMRNVEYLTSIAVFPLVATRTAAEEAGVKVVLCNLSDAVAKVLTVVQLIVESREHANHFSVAGDLDGAIALLNQ